MAVAWFRDGFTYTQIAHRLASEFGITKTRNAVAGYVNRARAKGAQVPDWRTYAACERARVRAERQEEKVARKKPERRLPISGVEIVAPTEPEPKYTGFRGSLAILELRPAACCWPLGDPKEDNFRYCCEPAVGRYCTKHAALSRQSASERSENMGKYKALINERKRSRYA